MQLKFYSVDHSLIFHQLAVLYSILDIHFWAKLWLMEIHSCCISALRWCSLWFLLLIAALISSSLNNWFYISPKVLEGNFIWQNNFTPVLFRPVFVFPAEFQSKTYFFYFILFFKTSAFAAPPGHGPKILVSLTLTHHAIVEQAPHWCWHSFHKEIVLALVGLSCMSWGFLHCRRTSLFEALDKYVDGCFRCNIFSNNFPACEMILI